MKIILTKITPFFVLSIFGIIFCVVNIIVLLFSHDKGGLATGFLSVLALIFYTTYVFDRFIIKKISLRKVIIFEFSFLLILPFLFFYLNKSIHVRVESPNEYFIVIYCEKGLSSEQIPKTGLFDRTLTINGQTLIYLNTSLQQINDLYILTPNSWKDGHRNLYFDTIINAKHVSYHMFYHNFNIVIDDSILKQTIHQKDLPI